MLRGFQPLNMRKIRTLLIMKINNVGGLICQIKPNRLKWMVIIMYEWLKVRNCFTDEYVYDNGNHISWEEEIPTGWRTAFGKQMIDELNDILIKYKYTKEYRVVQIKEKYGQLRWYDNGYPTKASLEYNKWLNKYENLSENTCIICGKDATYVSKGYVLPLCDKH